MSGEFPCSTYVASKNIHRIILYQDTSCLLLCYALYYEYLGVVHMYYYLSNHSRLERTYKPNYDYQNFSPLANGIDLNREKYAILQTHWH